MKLSLSTACAVLKNVYYGLDVMCAELLWLAGPDRTYHSQLKRLETRCHETQCRLSQMTVVADPERKAVEQDLALLENDMAVLAAERASRHAAHLSRVREHFPESV